MDNRIVVTLADVCGAGNGIRAELRSAPAAAAETMSIAGVEVKTGDVQVTLEWTGLADLDLFVTDPNGAQVGYDNKTVASGGELDVDARARCPRAPATVRNVENIVWKTNPPTGSYRIAVDHYNHCEGGNGPVAYTVTLRRDGQVVGTPWTGTVGIDREQTYTFASP